MKRWIPIAFALCIVVSSACNRAVETRHGTSLPPSASPELQAIDSLMWQRPDSALMRLLPWFDTCCGDAAHHVSTATAYNHHYAHLLLAELLYKNDYEQTNREELRQTVAYFDSLTLTLSHNPKPRSRHGGLEPASPNPNATLFFLAARAHYINGVGYYERDSVVEACKEYINALETMEGRFSKKELVGKKAKFMALTYTHLTLLFSDLYLHEQAIYFGQLSLSFYQKYNAALWHIAWMLNEIGSNYDVMEKLDSADCYYRKAINILGDTSTLMYRNIVAHQAYLEYKKDCHKAEAAVSSLIHLLSVAESDREKMTRYSYIGEILFHENQVDSAWMFLSIVFQETPDIGLKKQAAERLVEICKVQQRNTEILEYADFLVPFANQEENKSEIKSQLTELYKTFIQERLERQHYKEARMHIIRTLAIIVGMFFMILLISLLYHKNRRHKQKLEILIESERQAHKIQQAALSGRLKRSNAALKEHNKTILTLNSSPSPFRENNSTMNYEEEPICQYILALCNDKKNPIKSTVPVAAYADIALNDTQKAQLKDAAMQHYGSLFEKLKQQYPALKEKDFQYCYLCLLGLDNVQIAVLLQNSVSTIWEREKRLKKILGSEDRIAIILRGYMIN